MNSNSDPDAICSIACKRVLDKDFDEPSGVGVVPGTWRDADGNLVDELNTPSSETAEAQTSLRDQFAAAVLPGIFSHAVAVNGPIGFTNQDWRKGVASEAYAIADEMLAARNA